MNDKVILIVGAGGIGAACARLFSKTGARIVIASKNQDKAEKVAEEINDEGGEAFATQVDVTQLSSVASMVNDTAQELGKIDVLVNAFGIGILRPLLDIRPDEARKMIDTNLYGTFLVTQTVMRYMETNKKGDVIFFPGILGKHGMKNSSLYSATKFALTGFVQSLIEETRRTNIRFSLFYLGSVDTPMWNENNIEMKFQRQKMLSTEEVAKAVYYSISQPSGSVLNEIVIQPQSSQLM